MASDKVTIAQEPAKQPWRMRVHEVDYWNDGITEEEIPQPNGVHPW